MKPIAVAVLNWNGRHLLERYLPSVYAHSKHLAHIYVIDNDSTDDSISWLEKNYPDITIIKNKGNSGYAGGYNQAMPSIKEELVALLNSDIETTEGWIEPILQLFETHKNLAACQPKLRDLKRPEYFEYAGAAGGFMDWLCYPFCRGRIFYQLEKDFGQYDQTGDVFWATGAALILRKAHYFEAGGLDESLFAHMEEIDLCWRMHRKGHRVMYCAESTVYHLGGATLHETSPRKTYLNFRNNLIIMSKNLPRREFLGKLIIRLILDGVAGIKFLLEGKGAHTWQVLRAHFAFYTMFPGILGKRNFEPNRPATKQLPGTFRSTIIWHYFVKKQRTFASLPKKYFTGKQF